MKSNKVYLENETDDPLLTPSLADRVCEGLKTAAAELLGDEAWSVCLVFTDDGSIRALNKERRSIDSITDVLSFPMWDFCAPCEAGEELVEDEDGTVCLGDIVISFDTAKRQARQYGHSLLRECAFLAVHSLLHLVGYDHIDDGDRVIMEKKQREIMKLINIPRDGEKPND